MVLPLSFITMLYKYHACAAEPQLRGYTCTSHNSWDLSLFVDRSPGSCSLSCYLILRDISGIRRHPSDTYLLRLSLGLCYQIDRAISKALLSGLVVIHTTGEEVDQSGAQECGRKWGTATRVVLVRRTPRTRLQSNCRFLPTTTLAAD